MASSFDVVIAGGGIAALEALLGVRELAPEAVRIQLLAPEREFVHRPMFVAEPFGIGEAAGSSSPRSPPTTAPLSRGCARVRRYDRPHPAHVRGRRSPLRRAARCRRRSAGASSTRALTFGDPNEREFFTALLDQLGRRPGEQLAFLVPPEVKWSLAAYELALLTASHLEERAAEHAKVAVVTHEAAPLEIMGADGAHALRELLRSARRRRDLRGRDLIREQEGPTRRRRVNPQRSCRRLAGAEAPTVDGFPSAGAGSCRRIPECASRASIASGRPAM